MIELGEQNEHRLKESEGKHSGCSFRNFYKAVKTSFAVSESSEFQFESRSFQTASISEENKWFILFIG